MLSCPGIPLQESYFWPMCSEIDLRKNEGEELLLTTTKEGNLRFIFSSPYHFLSQSFSLALKLWTFLSENIIILVKTLPYFTQMTIFSPNTSFWTKKSVIWWLFHDNLRAREQEEKVTTNSMPNSPDYQLGWAILGELGS